MSRNESTVERMQEGFIVAGEPGSGQMVKGDQGGGLPASTRDVRIDARCLTERWPITPEQRREVMDRLLAIVRDQASTPREITAASKALLSADQINVASDVADKLPDHSEEAASARYDRLRAILDRLDERHAEGPANATQAAQGGPSGEAER